MERLQKVIAASGYTSRRKAEDLIVQGKVEVNGQVVRELGTKVKKGDIVTDYFTDVKERIYPVGRLDFDTTGLIIMSNDGEFANMIMHPRSHLEKIYEVSVKGLINGQTLNKLEKGIYLEGVKTLPCKIKVVNKDIEHKTTMLKIKLVEGKNRQVKKMFESVGHPVKRLHRVSIGCVNLKGLTPGKYRILKPQEVKDLKKLVNDKK